MEKLTGHMGETTHRIPFQGRTKGLKICRISDVDKQRKQKRAKGQGGGLI